MDEHELKNIIESLLMTHNAPLSIQKILGAFEDWHKPTEVQVEAALMALSEDYLNRAIEIKYIAGGYCIQTKKHYSTWIARLADEKPAKYSPALLEVLAIIAYRQPVTRADIEDIRGVAVSSAMLKTLLEREWIHMVGHRDVPGKPAVYATTKTFLDYFNLVSLNDLPSLEVVTNE